MSENGKVFNRIAIKYGGFEVSKYLSSYNLKFATFIIDVANNEVQQIDGFVEEKLLEISKDGFAAQLNGIYALYGVCHGGDTNIPVHTFMIEKDFWHIGDPKLVELIVFHEICHLLEKTKYYIDLGVDLSAYEKEVGLKLSQVADKIYSIWRFGKDEDHNQEFCALLYHYLLRFDKQECMRNLELAMSKTIFDEFPTELREQNQES